MLGSCIGIFCCEQAVAKFEVSSGGFLLCLAGCSGHAMNGLKDDMCHLTIPHTPHASQETKHTGNIIEHWKHPLWLPYRKPHFESNSDVFFPSEVKHSVNCRSSTKQLNLDVCSWLTRAMDYCKGSRWSNRCSSSHASS